MQINKFKIKNFKGIANFETELKQINVILGPNGIGKSTILQAFRYALTGKAPTDAVRLGTAMGYVAAEFQDIGLIQRGWDSKGSKMAMNGKTTTAKSIADSIKSIYGISPETAGVITSGELLAGMAAGDVSKFFVNEGFLKLAADVDKVIKYGSLTADAQDELRHYFPPAPEPVSVDDIKEAHAYYFEARKAVKRDVEAAKNAAVYTGVAPPAPSADIVKKRDEVSGRLGKAKAEADSYKALKAAFDRHAQVIADLQAKADAIKAKKPLSKNEDSIKKQIADIQKETSEAERTAGVIKNSKEQMEKLLRQLSEPVCPISGKLVCTTDKTAVSGEVKDTIKKADEEYCALQNKLAGLAEKKTLLENELAGLVKDAALYQQKADYIVQIEKMKKDAPNEPKSVEAVDISVLQGELANLTEAYGLAVKYEESCKAAERYNKLAKKLDVYQELVQALSPKNGIIQKIIEQSVIPLEDYCNDRIGIILPGYKVKFDTSDGIRVLLADTNGRTISYDAASRGEKLRVRFLILDMLNALSGFKVLMLDDLDSLDGESLKSLLTLLNDEEVIKGYDHVFLCGIGHAEITDVLNKAFVKSDSQFLTI